jgi:hypothetical protein
MLVLSIFDAPDELRTATYIVRRTALQICWVSDSVTISTNTHAIKTLTWTVPTSWADAANGPLTRINIYGIVTFRVAFYAGYPYLNVGAKALEFAVVVLCYTHMVGAIPPLKATPHLVYANPNQSSGQ